MNIAIDDKDVQRIAEKLLELLAPRLNVNKQIEEIFDKKGVAAYLHVEASWVDKNLYTIPHFKVGKYVRFRQSHIDKWIETNKVMPSLYLKMAR